MQVETSFLQPVGLPPDEVVIDVQGHEVRRGGRRIFLTHLEFQLLRTLAAAAGRVLTRDELLALWGERRPGSRRCVDIHIARLRRKLGTPSNGIIETVRQVGYRCPLVPPGAPVETDPRALSISTDAGRDAALVPDLYPRFVRIRPAAVAPTA